jgi:hypothetical protein
MEYVVTYGKAAKLSPPTALKKIPATFTDVPDKFKL